MRLFRVSQIASCILVLQTFLFAGDAQWVEVRSPNFSVITDAGERRGRDVALHFEQMRSVFGTLMTRAHVNLAVPLQIVAFRNTKEMRQVAPIFNGKPTEMAGLFQGGEDRSFIMLDMSVESPWTVVFHEYAHRLMDGNLPVRVDPWFEEGFAEYFSSIEVDNKEARVGKIPEQTYEILERMGMMKVTDLFRVQHYSKTYNENGDHRNTFYAESSLVVHYIYDNNLLPKLQVYFDATRNQGKPVAEAIQLAFGMSAEQLDKTLRSYLSSGRYRYYPIPTPAGIVPAQFTSAAVGTGDARALVADIHAHSPDYRDQALGEFEEVLKTDPNNAAALRGAGFVCLQHKDFAQAADYLRRAVQLNSKDARVHFYYAMLLNQQGARDRDKVAEIKKELSAAIDLDPTLADAYSLLGFTQATSGEPEKGLEAMRKAVELAPRDEHYQFNLASVYMMSRKPDDAIAIWKNLAGSEDRAIAAQARQNLEQAVNFKQRASQTELRIVNQDQEASAREVSISPQQVQDAVPAGAAGPLHFLKGKLLGVDCSQSPGAVLTVVGGGKSIRAHVRDREHVVLIGADAFSCEWRNKNAAVNYRERPDGDVDVVSVEVQ